MNWATAKKIKGSGIANIAEMDQVLLELSDQGLQVGALVEYMVGGCWSGSIGMEKIVWGNTRNNSGKAGWKTMKIESQQTNCDDKFP